MMVPISLLVMAAMPLAAAAAPAPPHRTSVILDTDIGDDIDDTWALALALKSPELDVKLVVTDFGNTEHRAKIVARLLEVAGRTDVPIGIGLKQNDQESPQAGWVKGYDLAKYPGTVHRDGVQALIDVAMASPEPMTLIAIGPPPNLQAALEREPRIAGKLRFAGMYGSLRRGYGASSKPEPEWNVRANVAAARAVLAAPWVDAIATPLDTCARAQLEGERYARVRDSKDPVARAVIESFRLWCANREWCVKDHEQVTVKSSTLFDTVAVYLAISRDFVKTERMGVRITDDGMTVPDPAARTLAWATEWKDLDAFEDWLAARIAGRDGGR
jgi:inosine-uridine nucleoside N-ribohydrolase